MTTHISKESDRKIPRARWISLNGNQPLDGGISEVTRRLETSEQLNNMFCFLWSPSSLVEQED